MVQKVFGLISDGGDGSSAVLWFRDEKIVDRLLEDDQHCEQFYANEGSPAETLTFPDDLDLDTIGFSFADDYFPLEDDEEVDEDEND
jgi:hypothetical protein